MSRLSVDSRRHQRLLASRFGVLKGGDTSQEGD